MISSLGNIKLIKLQGKYRKLKEFGQRLDIFYLSKHKRQYNVYELNMYLIVLFMYSYFSNSLKYFINYFTLSNSMHSHNTCSASNTFIDYKRTNLENFHYNKLGRKSGTIYQKT